MNPIPILAATTAAGASVMDAVPHLLGMLMVVGTLATLWGVCAVTAKLVKTFLPEKKPMPSPAPAPAAPSKAASAPAPASGIAPEIVAVIAAAVATIAGKQAVRIISIKPMSTSWERAGRQSVLTSHRIR